MIVENSLNERLNMKKHALCIIIALKLIILQKKPSQGWRNEPMTLPKPLQMRASSTLTNPFITSAENDSSNVSPANDNAQNSSHIHQQADEAPKPFNFGFNFI